MVEPYELSALEQAAAVRRRELSPVELVTHLLARIDRYGERVGAFVTVTPDLALAQARAAERAVLDARDPLSLPPLLGVPLPVKDLTAVAGVRCTYGSAAYAEAVADADDGVVTKLRAAGTVMPGKTSTAEFGISCYTETSLAPPARTPWDLTRSAGGSSGGAGAAVAAGLAAVAHGSDGGGSVRIPASVCGLVGLKPSRGRVSNGPRAGDVSGLPTHGVLARTVTDAAAVLDALAGPLPGDPVPLPSPAEPFLAAVGRPPPRLRVGAWSSPVLADVPVAAEVLTAYDDARTLLEELGHEVEDAPGPFGPEVAGDFEAVWRVLAALVPVPPGRDGDLLPLTRHLRRLGAEVSGVAYASALAAMQAAARAAAGRWRTYDVLLSPTIAALPAVVGAIRDDEDPARDFVRQKEFSPYCAAYNVTGQPAISLPLHWTAGGLPVGVMLATRAGDEATLLSLAAQIEAACPWASPRPGLV